MSGRGWQWIAAGVLAVALAACGGGGSSNEGAPPAPPPTTSAATLDGAGGTVADSRGAAVIVPAGALQQSTTIRIANESIDAPPLPQGLSAAGAVWAITPHGATFDQPVEVRLPAPAVTLQADQALAIVKAQPGGSWEVMPTQVQDGSLTTQVTSFSYFTSAIITYPQSLVQVPPYDVVTRLDCQPGCLRNVGPVSWTLSWQPNGGMLPATCPATATPTIKITIRSGGTTPEVLRFPFDRAGSLTRTDVFQPSGGMNISPRLECLDAQGRDQGFALRWERVVSWELAGAYPAIRHLRSPEQIDVLPGTAVTMESIFAGGAAEGGSADDRAVVDWERSDDNGTSWRVVGRTYQNEANRQPFPSVPAWTYWSVRHGFTAAAGDQGARLRAHGCYSAPAGAASAPSTRCSAGPAARINVLQGGAVPAFSTEPRPVLVRIGETASFTVVTTGAPAPTLSWQSRPANSTAAWTDVGGATAATYTTPPLALSDNGRQYRVVATNAMGSTASAPVTVSVSEVEVAPTITTQPASITVTAGNDAVFAVVARGTEALSYQWRYLGEPISGANSPVYRLSGTFVGQSGEYSVQVSNAAGTVVSNTVTLTVTPAGSTPAAVAPSIVSQPVNVTVNAGNTATFAVGATGSAPIAYQWLRNGQPIAGATQAFYSLAAAQPGDAGSYAVQVSNGVGSGITSASATLTVNAQAQAEPVAITTQPSPQVQVPGGSATFAVAASGTGPLAYQWLKDGQPIAGATGAVLVLPGVTGGDAGQYSVTVGNALNSVTSNAAALIVVGAPVITAQPAATTASAGATATFSVTAQGPALRYQWLRNSVAIAGATSSSYTTPVLTSGDSGAVYAVVVYNTAGTVFSNAAVLTVTGAATAFPAGAVPLRGTHADFGSELWITDGTEAGTRLVKDLWPGAGNGQPRDFTRVGELMLFVANDGSSGEELWRTDGTDAGTVRVADINPGADGSLPWGLVACNGRLFFGANNGSSPGVYVSDGTSAGTQRLADVILGLYDPVACLNGVVYFHGATAAHGGELWRSDGTAAGTTLLADIVPGTGSSSPEGFTLFQGQLYFQAANTLWRTDGTPGGTVQVSAAVSTPRNFVVNGNLLYFSGTTAEAGTEPWRSDGTAQGTQLVADIVPGTPSSYPYSFTVSNGVTFFAANPASNIPATLWRTDGTAAGTTSLASLRFVGAYGRSMLDVNGTLFFSAAATGSDVELYKSDGTAAGTVLVADLYPGSSGSYATSFFLLGNVLHLNVTTPDFGSELFRSDGTASGTVVVKDLCAPGCSGNPQGR